MVKDTIQVCCQICPPGTEKKESQNSFPRRAILVRNTTPFEVVMNLAGTEKLLAGTEKILIWLKFGQFNHQLYQGIFLRWQWFSLASTLKIGTLRIVRIRLKKRYATDTAKKLVHYGYSQKIGMLRIQDLHLDHLDLLVPGATKYR